MASNTASNEIPKLSILFPAGLNQNENPDIGEASAGYNFELGARQTELAPRLAFDLKGTAPNKQPVTGICQLVKRNGNQTTLVFADSTCYLWDGANNWNSWTIQAGGITSGGKMRDVYWSLGDYLVMVDVSTVVFNVVKMWDGVTYQSMPFFSDVAHITPYTPTFSCQYAVVFNSRMWYFNITSNGVNYPHMIVASYFEDPQIVNVSTRGGPTNLGGSTFPTGLEAFYILTPDLKAINGVSVFQNVLVISTIDGQLHKLTGSSAADYQFVNFYVGSSAVGTEAIQNIGNDVIYIRKGGNINLLRSVQYFGDVRSNDVARWIPQITKNIPDALIVYEQTSQKVLFFIQNKILVLFKDILYGAETDSAVNQGLSPWSVYVTDHPNQFNVQAAKYMQIPGTTNYSTYFGDVYGNVYDINGTGGSDGGIYQINLSRTTKLIDDTVMTPFPWKSEIILGRVQYHRVSQASLNISFTWSDEYNVSNATVQLKGPATNTVGVFYGGNVYYQGNFFYNQGFQATNSVSHQHFSPSGKGTGFYITLSSQSNAAWSVDHLELY